MISVGPAVVPDVLTVPQHKHPLHKMDVGSDYFVCDVCRVRGTGGIVFSCVEKECSGWCSHVSCVLPAPTGGSDSRHVAPVHPQKSKETFKALSIRPRQVAPVHPQKSKEAFKAVSIRPTLAGFARSAVSCSSKTKPRVSAALSAALSQQPKPRSCSRHAKCEHGSRKNACALCKGCRICPHGRQKYHCKECPRGNCWCKHDKQRSKCHICTPQ